MRHILITIVSVVIGLALASADIARAIGGLGLWVNDAHGLTDDGSYCYDVSYDIANTWQIFHYNCGSDIQEDSSHHYCSYDLFLSSPDSVPVTVLVEVVYWKSSFLFETIAFDSFTVSDTAVVEFTDEVYSDPVREPTGGQIRLKLRALPGSEGERFVRLHRNCKKEWHSGIVVPFIKPRGRSVGPQPGAAERVTWGRLKSGVR